MERYKLKITKYRQVLISIISTEYSVVVKEGSQYNWLRSKLNYISTLIQNNYTSSNYLHRLRLLLHPYSMFHLL